jgi:SPX domain protein involved in polyphosphate accumulation
MKFGKDFRNHLEGTLPDWKDKYLAYKALKKLIKTLPPDADADQPTLPPPPAGDGDGAAAAEEGLGFGDVALGNWFARILDVELQKLNDFYIEREEWYVIRLQVRTPPHPSPLHLSPPAPFSPRARVRSTEISGDRDLDRADFGLCWGIDG